MRAHLPLLLGLLAACSSASAPPPAVAPALEPEPEAWPAALAPARCVLDAPRPTAERRHPIAGDFLHFGPCGHLAVDGRVVIDPSGETAYEAGSTWGNLVHFAPTGEGVLLGNTNGDSLTLLDLATWQTHSVAVDGFPGAGWVPRRDRTASILWSCVEDLLVVRGADGASHALGEAQCDRPLSPARVAPLLAFVGPDDRLQVADLERRTVATSPFEVVRQQNPYRSDSFYLSADGRIVVFQEVGSDGTGIPDTAPALAPAQVWDRVTGVRWSHRPDRQHFSRFEILDRTHRGGGIAWTDGPDTLHLRGQNELRIYEDLHLVALTPDRTVGLVLPYAFDAQPKWDWVDLATGAREPIEWPVAHTVLPSEQGNAWLFGDGAPAWIFHPDHGWQEIAGSVGWLGDDGAFLAYGDRQSWLAAPGGEALATFDGWVHAIHEAGPELVALLDRELVAVDRQTGITRTLSEDHGYAIAADAAGERIAWTEAGGVLVVAPARAP